MFFDQTDPPSPAVVAFALLITSSSLVQGWTGTIGP
jgi:hypothetical protein